MVGLTLAMLLASQSVIGPAPGLAMPIPATGWSCLFHGRDGNEFRLSGRLPEFPVGFDPNRSLETAIEGEGFPASGRAFASPGHASDWFREAQVSASRGRDTYRVNLNLRRDGTSVAHITLFQENDQRIPYDYFAAGLCSADFDLTDLAEGAPQ